MKLILLTHPDFFIQEHIILDAMFEEGLDMLHILKPNSEPIFCERLLKLMDKGWRKKIVTHEHFYLKNEFKLHGIHLSQRNPEPPAKPVILPSGQYIITVGQKGMCSIVLGFFDRFCTRRMLKKVRTACCSSSLSISPKCAYMISFICVRDGNSM